MKFSRKVIPCTLATAFFAISCGNTTVTTTPEPDSAVTTTPGSNTQEICLPTGESAPESVALREKVEIDGEVRFREIQYKLLYHGDIVEIVQPLTQGKIAGIDPVILVRAPFGEIKAETGDNVSEGFVQEKYFCDKLSHSEVYLPRWSLKYLVEWAKQVFAV